MHNISKRSHNARLSATRLAATSTTRVVHPTPLSARTSSSPRPAPAALQRGWTRALATAAAPPFAAFTASSPAPGSASPPAGGRKPLFTKILIANRGEIACRVIRTARRLGIRTVAVFSEADRDSMHVKMADEAYLVGPAPSAESYLRMDRIIEVCKKSGAQAVHPGYGFLSENAGFAKKLEESGIVFIGPPASAIVSMGSKAESKDIMLAASVPCVPGFHPSTIPGQPSDPANQEPAFLLAEARKIGFPVLIKAVSGGGGKGMKIVDRELDFEGQLESAKREARASFGDDEVLLEKYIAVSRHIEVQIFSSPEETVSLSTRDCSVQRRHQKILEEAPAPGLSQELRDELEATARRAAKAVGYVGAGTVEFIVDAHDPSQYYFMEMNTRLQVEHCVTEAVTNVDLVEWQLEVASGNPLPLSQDQIEVTGHAFEARIYAEQPRNNFLPDTGLLRHVQLPAASDKVRIETGFGAGDQISVYYDPLIAKLIVSGPSRKEALHAMNQALKEYQVVGPHTNLHFLRRLTAHDAFINEQLETGFIAKHRDALFAPETEPDAADLAQVGLYLASKALTDRARAGVSPWTDTRLAGFRNGARAGGAMVLELERPVAVGAEAAEGAAAAAATVVKVKPAARTFGSQTASFDVHVTAAGAQPAIFADLHPATAPSGALAAVLDATRQQLHITPEPATREAGDKFHLFSPDKGLDASVSRKLPAWLAAGAEVKKAGSARAPMPSRVVQVMVKAGQSVKQGDPLVMVEAMKTEHVLRAPKDGVVSAVKGEVGELVKEGAVLVEFEDDGEEAK